MLNDVYLGIRNFWKRLWVNKIDGRRQGRILAMP